MQMSPTALRAPARAKLNLYLHVGPARADGYHELDSYVAFAEDGDWIEAAPADTLSLVIDGPFAPALAGEPISTNLVWRAAEALRAEAGLVQGARILLHKALPIASGVGGGSADAAAALWALNALWGAGADTDDLERLGFGLGADVPMCVRGAPAFARGAGEALSLAPCPPETALVLVNPGAPTPTGAVFRRFDEAPAPSGAAPAAPADFADAPALAAYLATARNDLEAPACALVPAIADVLALLKETTGCLLARMSGSGATCFALFETAAGAAEAAAVVRRRRPSWWAMATRLDRAALCAGAVQPCFESAGRP